MDNLKDKIIDYKTYRFNIIFFSKSKNHISKSYSNMILDKKTGKVGISKKALRDEGGLRERFFHCFFPRK